MTCSETSLNLPYCYYCIVQEKNARLTDIGKRQTGHNRWQNVNKKRTTQLEIKSKILVIETKLDEFSGDATLTNIPPCVKSPRKRFS